MSKYDFDEILRFLPYKVMFPSEIVDKLDDYFEGNISRSRMYNVFDMMRKKSYFNVVERDIGKSKMYKPKKIK